MYTQCSTCLTIYQINADIVAKSRGKVRCAQCSTIFDSLRTLSEQPPDELDGQLQPHTVEVTPPQLQIAVKRPSSPQANLFTSSKLSPHFSITPEFVTPPKSQQKFRPWMWITTNIILLLGFAGQFAYAKREWLLSNHQTRLWMDQICHFFQCQLPLSKDLAYMHLLSRDIRPHPSVSDALIISATLHNAAPFTQVFPEIEVTLSDLDDKILGKRRFRSADYISDPNLRENGMAPNVSVALSLEIVEPAQHAVAFEFAFF